MQWHHSYVAIHSFTLYDIEHSAAGGVRASICRLKKVMSEARGIYNSACKDTTLSACPCNFIIAYMLSLALEQRSCNMKVLCDCIELITYYIIVYIPQCLYIIHSIMGGML